MASSGGPIQVQVKVGLKLGWALQCKSPVRAGGYLMCTPAATSQGTPKVRCREAKFCHQIQLWVQAAKGRPELWNRGWLNAGMELGGREGASDVRGSGAVAKNRKACLRVCFYCLFTMYVGMCVAHRPEYWIRAETQHYWRMRYFTWTDFSKYLKQILLNVYIQHFQRNLLNGLYVSWLFKAERMSLM